MGSGRNWLRYAILAILTVAFTRGVFLGAPDDSQGDWIAAIRDNSWKDQESSLSSVSELKQVEDALTSPLLDVPPGKLASITGRTGLSSVVSVRRCDFPGGGGFPVPSTGRMGAHASSGES